MSRSDEVLAEQLRYYREGATQYDAANRLLRTTDDTDGRARREGWREAVASLGVVKDRSVLELAGGTGVYTEVLAELARDLTVVDASPESLDINRRMTAEAGVSVRYLECDLFEWEPTERYEVVVFAFWLSHVPVELFGRFWSLVDRSLVDGGSVVVIDAGEPASDVADGGKVSFFSEERIDESTSVRFLADGTAYRIVRVLWNRRRLAEELTGLGWQARFAPSDWLIANITRMA